ncbi:cryptochrome/photolyase family protein [Sanguibacter suarezii]|uniref:cryptochrome/photolyase family protein n=1 Tax=Sanguibacter suarezii TaxID=60921 RepID=UPI000830F6D3|nr:deoxyribodipyrimidine photo-lyase [Sanguibacter suarezii]
MTALHWFRRDLRLADNPALAAAAGSSGGTGGTGGTGGRAGGGADVVGLYVLDPALWEAAGPPRRRHLRASLAALSASMGGALVVRTGDPTVVVPRLVREIEVAEVHVSESFEPYGRWRDARTAHALHDAGARFVPLGSPYAVSPGRVVTQAGNPYKVFTPFRSAWLAHGWRRPAPRPQGVRWLDLGSDALPDDPTAGNDGSETADAAGEQAALARWQEFLERVDSYDSDRDRPDLDLTSRLSTALKWGEIHPRTLLADLAERPGVGAASYRSELAWREFHADVLFHAPSAARSSLRPVLPDDSWTPEPLAQEWFTRWAQGRTGYPMVDAGMRQLLAEGWMHGRTRMVVASFLVKDLHLPWQRGAQHFMDHLLDADVSQNQLNWQWVAGTGHDAAPYFRIFNPVAQGLRFDPDGDYVRRWVPELREVPGRAVHEPWKLPAPPPGYPERMVDHAHERAVTLDDYARGKDR